jgi:thiosulfate dehydrogenase [quinone] large subunit
MRVLRAFLGVTFVYAGIQKFADPNFLHAGTPDYIGSQLQAFANGSPIAPLLKFLSHLAVPTGVGIALTEIAIGVGTLLGVARFASAIGGFVVSLALFLSASWHVHPYFLGSDSIYAVAWLAYFAGLWEAERRRRSFGAGPGHRASAVASADLSRRQLLRGGLVAGATLLLAGVGSAVKGSPSAAASGFTPVRPKTHRNGGVGPHHTKRPGGPATTDPTTAPTTEPSGSNGGNGGNGNGGGQGGTVQGKTIASLDSLPVGGAVPFNGPGGEPCALFRLGQTDVAAFSRVCTHAGCLVGYDSSSHLLVCPCHGAEFDPSQGATPVAGPAPTPLPSVRVVVDRSNGTVVLPN